MTKRWNFRSPLGDVTVVHRRDLNDERRLAALPRSFAIHAIEACLLDPSARRKLLEVYALVSAVRVGQGREADARLARGLIDAFRRGDLVALREERPNVAVPRANVPPVLGPSGAFNEPRSELTVVLLDHAGRVASHVGCVVVTPDGVEKTFAKGARFHIDDIDLGLCRVRFPELEAPTGAPLSPEAPPDEVIEGATAIFQSTPIPEVETRKPPHVFQLTRRTAAVVELEHFSDDGEVFLPGPPPCELRPRAERLAGIDVLRACLVRAALTSVDRSTLTGHGDRAEGRVKNVAALLTRDREAWSQSAEQGVGADDVSHILRWVSQTTGWNCNPDVNDAALRFFKDAYNHQLEVDGDTDTPKLLGDDLDRATFGAFFDMYARALWPKTPKKLAKPYLVVNDRTQTYPVRLAEIATGDANRYKEMYPLNPGRQIPGNAGWFGPEVGDTLWLPRDWDRDKLRAKDYDVFDGEPPPEPIVPALAPMAAPGPTIQVCGVHHLQHPGSDDARRRAPKRRVELVFFDQAPEKICSADAECSDQTCELYDPYSVRLDYLDPDPKSLLGTTFLYGIPIGPEQQWSDAAVIRVVSEDGAQEQSLPLCLGLPSGALRFFQVVGILPHTRYRGELRDRELLIELFPFTELHRIQDPDDLENVLPPPEPAPAAPWSEPGNDGGTLFRVRLFDQDALPMTASFYRLTVGGRSYQGLAEDGWAGAVLPDTCPVSAVLEWSDPEGTGTYEYRTELALDCDEGDDSTQLQAMLNNLGYPASSPLDTRVRAFQSAHSVGELGLDESGRIPPMTRAKIRETYSTRIGT